MNQKQKKILELMIIIIVGMFLCPPYVSTYNGVVYNLGYGLIIDPPKLEVFGRMAVVVNVGMLITQWLGVLLVGGLALFLSKDPTDASLSASVVSTSAQENLKPETPSPEKSLVTGVQSERKPGPKGVGGWLLLLVVGMMLIGPVLGGARILGEFSLTEKWHLKIASVEGWQTYKTVTWWIFFAAAAGSFLGGLGLANGKDWTVVRFAIVILWITGPGVVLVLNFLVPIMIFGHLKAGYAQPVEEFIAILILAIFWTTYLSKSKRVRNTYAPHSL